VISDRLAGFISSYCDSDLDPDDPIRLLHGPHRHGYLAWLPDDLRAAIESGDFTVERATDLTNIYFPDQAAVERWLRTIWRDWFDRPYPV
jgi:hypothetical protein